MTRGWKLVLDEAAVEFVLAARASHRRSLLRLFEQLRADPYTRGDFEEHDETGRALQVQHHQNWLITFWADHGAKELRIVEIESVGC